MKIISNEEYLRDFFENAPIGFHMFGPDKLIIDINHFELQLLGYAREEIIGRKTWADLILPKERARFERHWRDINKKGKVENLQYTLVSKKGKQLEVLLNASARFDAEGNLINTRGSILDVTKKNQMQKKIVRSQAKMRQQKQSLEKQNEALNRLLQGIEAEKERIKGNVVNNLERVIFPVIGKIKRRGTSTDQKNVEFIERALRKVTEDFGTKVMDQKWKLSTREIEICNMIKSGFSTKEIAELLCSSIRTIENHRNHIRKKLNISQENIDLAAYLRDF